MNEVALHGRADRVRAEAGGDSNPGAEVIRRIGVSEQAFYRWKKLYGGLGMGDLRPVKPPRADSSDRRRSGH